MCLVPAAMPYVSMATQPTPMFMVAPMAAPMMMPYVEGDAGSHMVGMGSMPSNLSGVPFSWPADGHWPYFNPYFGEEAPQQLPMHSFAPQAWPSDAPMGYDHCDWAGVRSFKEEVPSQIFMDFEMMQPWMTEPMHKKTTVCRGSLRRRGGPAWSAQDPSAIATDLPNLGEEQIAQELETDNEAAQARETANQLLEQLQNGGDSQQSAVASIERLAFTSKLSSRAAQIVLEEASMTHAALFATGLRGNVRSAVQSKHANHVVQKITEVMPVSHASFVVDELRGFGQEVARHPFGCRVLCRILEHLSPNDLNAVELMEEVLADLDELCSHPFGSFVIRHILEFGLPEHKKRVVKALFADLGGLAKHKFGSHVAEAALRHASLDDQQALARELLGKSDQLMVLAANQFGRHVVRALLGLPGALKKEVVDALTPMQNQLKSSRYGKSVLQALRVATAS